MIFTRRFWTRWKFLTLGYIAWCLILANFLPRFPISFPGLILEGIGFVGCTYMVGEDE